MSKVKNPVYAAFIVLTLPILQPALCALDGYVCNKIWGWHLSQWLGDAPGWKAFAAIILIVMIVIPGSIVMPDRGREPDAKRAFDRIFALTLMSLLCLYIGWILT